ncbi:IS1595 family transposase [Acuticoccus sp. MNP-M23]|uniref:IS1595 family transposase n=1 Tax=Acuticoccus sp. MNP-M23 TaxID=3072793 RepID=UPI0028161AAA|nr:IS1595 family transposase [Acuticoccus sp. MNP-M23]WMS42528.1 IS1595 family transposase [Acuticoccus sp. MNP-M23]
MAQHFLLSASARTLRLKDIYRAGEEKAYETFCAIRWSENDGKPVCPRCGSVEAYSITTRRKFKCRQAECRHQFSVTSGTIFASRKMDFTDLLGAIAIFVNAVKGVFALQLSRDLCVQYKTAFVLAHKLREALSAEIDQETPLEGDVEVDGAYFGGHIRPANEKKDRVDRRLKEHQTGKRRVVVAFRERGGRVVPFICREEGEGVDIAQHIVSRMATMHADEASHWDRLHAGWTVGRINHSIAYSTPESCTNQVESFFSRLRRMVVGQHHGVSAQYLYQYANEAAWKEDNRRVDNGTAFRKTLRNALTSPVSRAWAGYWQR